MDDLETTLDSLARGPEMEAVKSAPNAAPSQSSWAAYDVSLPGHPSFRPSVQPVRRVIVEEKDAATFVNRLRELYAHGEFVGEVWVATAAVRELLIDPEWEAQVQCAIRTIKVASARQDKKSLGRFRSAIEGRGLKPGPKTTLKSTEWKIETLHAMAQGKALKAALSHRKRKPNSASAELSRYCKEFYSKVRFFESVLGIHTEEFWQKLMEIGNEESWLGSGHKRGWSQYPWLKQELNRFGFSFPADLSAAKEAYRRGKKHSGVLSAT
jgi:hypothetical protein